MRSMLSAQFFVVLNVSEPRPTPATNQRAGLKAVICAVETVLREPMLHNTLRLRIITDSRYFADGLTQWLPSRWAPDSEP